MNAKMKLCPLLSAFGPEWQYCKGSECALFVVTPDTDCPESDGNCSLVHLAALDTLADVLRLSDQ